MLCYRSVLSILILTYSFDPFIMLLFMEIVPYHIDQSTKKITTDFFTLATSTILRLKNNCHPLILKTFTLQRNIDIGRGDDTGDKIPTNILPASSFIRVHSI